jgi:hypothetical protein
MKPTCSITEAFRQTKPTVSQYTMNAIDILDEEFGDGYAKKNPNLVAALVKAQTLDFNNCMMTAANYEIAESLRSLSIEFNEFLATK